MQIFFPYSQQLYPEEFPGSDPNDCPRDTAKAKWVQFDGNNRFYICPLIRPKHQISFALNLQLVLSGWQHYLEILTISAPGFECWPWLNLITHTVSSIFAFLLIISYTYIPSEVNKTEVSMPKAQLSIPFTSGFFCPNFSVLSFTYAGKVHSELLE